MIVIMSLCYLGCVVVAFRVIKIRPTPGHVAAAVLVGVVMLGGILVGWQMSAPMSRNASSSCWAINRPPQTRCSASASTSCATPAAVGNGSSIVVKKDAPGG